MIVGVPYVGGAGDISLHGEAPSGADLETRHIARGADAGARVLSARSFDPCATRRWHADRFGGGDAKDGKQNGKQAMKVKSTQREGERLVGELVVVDLGEQ